MRWRRKGHQCWSSKVGPWPHHQVVTLEHFSDLTHLSRSSETSAQPLHKARDMHSKHQHHDTKQATHPNPTIKPLQSQHEKGRKWKSKKELPSIRYLTCSAHLTHGPIPSSPKASRAFLPMTSLPHPRASQKPKKSHSQENTTSHIPLLPWPSVHRRSALSDQFFLFHHSSIPAMGTERFSMSKPASHLLSSPPRSFPINHHVHDPNPKPTSSRARSLAR